VAFTPGEVQILGTVDNLTDKPRVVTAFGPFLAEYGQPVEYVVQDIVPERAQVAIYAPSGVGKSLLALDMAVQVASGKPPFGTPGHRRKVMILDYENGDGTTADRLKDFGFTETETEGIDNYIIYCPYPDMLLDAPHGATLLSNLIDEHEPELIIIDSLNQSAQGDENEANTWINFQRHTSTLLRRKGIATLRLDNMGKNPKAKQRGSSKKRDDVDVSWELQVSDKGEDVNVTLTIDKNRFGKGPRLIRMQRIEDPYLTHRLVTNTFVSEKASVTIVNLKALNVPPGATNNEARKALREAGHKQRGTDLAEAVRWRKKWEETPPETPYQ
jgi:KaiC/GvpD/RAD55 family RecA-like ATPase